MFVLDVPTFWNVLTDLRSFQLYKEWESSGETKKAFIDKQSAENQRLCKLGKWAGDFAW